MGRLDEAGGKFEHTRSTHHVLTNVMTSAISGHVCRVRSVVLEVCFCTRGCSHGCRSTFHVSVTCLANSWAA